MRLCCAVPRCRCEAHGVKSVRVPWAEPESRFTLHFEAFAVAVMVACRSLTQAADLLRLHWDSVQRLIDRAVARGLARRSTEGVRRVGLYEKSFQRGQRYASLMTDLDGRRVLDVVAGRDTEQAVANSFAAVRAGARQIQGTLNGLGERCGNANLVTLIPTLVLKMGYETGIGTVLKPGKTFEKLAENNLGEKTLASYAVTDGAFFIRTEKNLYRIGAK